MASLKSAEQPMWPPALRQAHAQTRSKVARADGAPSDSIRYLAMAGWLIIAIFFGGMGTWAVTAPLNGAVVANGIIKVEGNRRAVQHLDVAL